MADMQARERMAREYGEQAGIPAMYLDWLIGMAEPWDALPRLDATFDSQEGAAAVVVEILRGGVVLPPSSGSAVPCPTCGGDGTACCGRYLDTGECCAALNGGAEMQPCPDCGGEGRAHG